MNRSSYNTLAESALVLLASTGDDIAFSELVRQRERPIRLLLRRLTGDSAAADDLAQETFIQAWRSLPNLREPGAFGGWLRQIALNRWLQQARRREPTFEDLDQHDVEDLDLGPSMAELIDLNTALTRLRAPERMCVVLAHCEGMTHPAIAQATGLPLGTVKSHVSRGLAKLRAWFEAGNLNLAGRR